MPSRSASSRITQADLPPSSSSTFLTVAAAAAITARPVTVEPVKATASTRGSVVSIAATSFVDSGAAISIVNPALALAMRNANRWQTVAPVVELAELLGAAVGCSRAVTIAGWRPHTEQVGQTGTRIAPDLYVLAGISGATQHMAGCRGAKVVLAINKDAEAPVMTGADYAIIGDMREVLSAISAEIKRRRAS